MATETVRQRSIPEAQGGLILPSSEPTKKFEIKEILTIGRDELNDVCLQDPFVSSRHARIERREKAGFIVRDLRSRNGTFVNGARVLEAYLKNGDRLVVGETELLFTDLRDSNSRDFVLTSLNAEWQKQLLKLTSLAQSDLPILLQGPSGSGKDILAQAIHQLSFRQGQPLVSVNCSALSESLIESELFGHVRGSFTGATHDRAGAFQAAHGGTLFLDEIGDLPLGLQPKLLRAIENAEIRPVGSDRTMKVQVRVISATHHILRDLVRSKAFREDLYFRLNVLRLNVPGLKSRMEDFDHFFYHFAKQARVRFSYQAIQELKNHSWPGNLRELRNVVSRAKAYFPNCTIEPEHLNGLYEQPLTESHSFSTTNSRLPVMREIEMQMIIDRLVANGGNQRRAADDLGMPKSTLHDRIKNYGINIEQILKERV